MILLERIRNLLYFWKKISVSINIAKVGSWLARFKSSNYVRSYIP